MKIERNLIIQKIKLVGKDRNIYLFIYLYIIKMINIHFQYVIVNYYLNMRERGVPPFFKLISQI